jgi:type I restriction enzyme S subunit
VKAGWEFKPIESFAKTGAGGTPAKSSKSFYEGGKIPWLLSGEVANQNITESRNFITEEGLKGSSAKLFPANSVLVAMYGATAGEVGILRFEAATNQAVCAVLPSNQYVPEYLYFYLLLAKASLVAQAVGNAQPNISQAKIKSLPIPLPPLEEQQRIVAVLDEAFEGLARARAHAEANLQNARELFAGAIHSEFAKVDSVPKRKIGDAAVRCLSKEFSADFMRRL